MNYTLMDITFFFFFISVCETLGVIVKAQGVRENIFQMNNLKRCEPIN